jgi:pilus assembly protein FimV
LAAARIAFALTAVAVTCPIPPSIGFIDEPVRLSAPDLTLSENDLSFSTDALDFPRRTPSCAGSKHHQPAPTQAPVADAGMIEFDLGSLSLDLDPPARTTAAGRQRPTTAYLLSMHR